jgi:hypothetical protein
MKTTLAALAASLLAGAMYIQPAQAQVQVQPGPGFSVEIGPRGPTEQQREEWRDREWRERQGYYGSGREEWREERWREERRARERCERIVNPFERDRCFSSLR